MTHYTMPAHLAEKDVHRWVFAHNLTPEVECTVRKWLSQRLDGFYCDLHDAYMSHVAGPEQARTHIVLNDVPLSTSSMARNDEAVEVNARDAAKALIKATGLNPHLPVCGWPFCLGDLDDANAEGGAA